MTSYTYKANGLMAVPSFFPEDLDVSEMINITTLDDTFERYLDPTTGKIHDGETYYNQMVEERS